MKFGTKTTRRKRKKLDEKWTGTVAHTMFSRPGYPLIRLLCELINNGVIEDEEFEGLWDERLQRAPIHCNQNRSGSKRNQPINFIKTGVFHFGREVMVLTKKEMTYTPPSYSPRNSRLEVIQKYGPLGTRSLRQLFDKFTGTSRTLVIIGWIHKSTIMNCTMQIFCRNNSGISSPKEHRLFSC
ncbi:hypothetical protein CAEBREN_23082 [Caenorhabditis brenneri]|uniref:Uncharacterized protein n=1 Tax=Caenorhabditis brenneri TaxID=135651 RepID=G0NB03_CAEBE|nr:hypothetical protein CAEBREN_23082 [Caenorhabditis brenneri]